MQLNNVSVNGDDCVNYQVGDGNGDEDYLGTVQSMEECIALVKTYDASANGATMRNPEGTTPPFKCYKEVGQTSANDSNNWVNCEIAPEQ